MNPRVGRAMTAPSAAFGRSPSVDDGTPAGERPEVADVGASLRRASRPRCGLGRTGHRTGVDDGMVGKNGSLEPARAAYAISRSNYLVRTPVQTTTQSRPVVERSSKRNLSRLQVALALIALATGGFGIGTTEFVTMGLLPDIARGINESIPTTGHIITAYALGVVVGAPVIVSLAARLPRRGLAVALVLSLGVGNAITAAASGCWPVMARGSWSDFRTVLTSAWPRCSQPRSWRRSTVGARSAR